MPEIPEQTRIAQFLDAECARIDVVIEQTRASIEEYKKLKQVVSTQAVTKGMRPNRPMKDSGVDWIGEIPDEWNCTRFKYIATVKSNLVQPDDMVSICRCHQRISKRDQEDCFLAVPFQK